MNSANSEYSETNSNHSLTLTDHFNADLLNNNQSENNKYDKLIQDYVKLRSKLTILKKAYVDLSEVSGQKDKSLRKYEQEIEGLNFRNQQLTSRVDNLQKELDSFKSRPLTTDISLTQYQNSNISPSKNDSVISEKESSRLLILEEELERRLNENVSLHKRVHEIETNCEQTVAKLELKLSGVEADRQALSVRLVTVEGTLKSSVEKLQNDRIKLEVSLGQKEAEISRLVKRLEVSSLKKEEDLRACRKPVLMGFIEEQIDSLVKIYTSVGERNELLRPVSARAGCSSVLLDCERVLVNELIPEIKAWDVDGCQERILSKLNKFCDCNRIVFNGDWLLEHENANGEVVSLNKKLKLQMNYLASLLFDNSDSYEFEQLKKFELSANQNNNRPFLSVVTELFNSLLSSTPILSVQLNQQFSSGLKSIQETVDKVLRILNEKLSIQYSLSYPASVTMVDECIVSYLTEFSQSLVKLQSFMSPGTGIVELSRGLLSLVDKKSEKELIKLANEKISKLQRESEDYQCLKFRFEQVSKELENLKLVESSQREIISKLRTVEKDEETAKMIEYYVQRIARLDEQVQELDGKAMFYYEEMKCMVERLRLEVEAKGVVDNDLNEVKDQLERTRSSYEMQMSTMSDHLIEITDKMSRQEADNERLRHELAMIGSGAKTGKAKKAK